MSRQRKALIVANDEYEQEGLRQLLAPAADADQLRKVLGDRQIGDFLVQVVRNEPAHVIQAQIEELFAESRPEDVLLLHFSCHGLKSESGELFFAASNTRPDRLGSTAISADFVQRCMRASRARSIVLLLDCCYGGAFAQGVTVRAAGDVNVLSSFPRERLGGGRGRAVITASSAMEYAFEGDRLADRSSPRPSAFTGALVEGLITGDADRDQDGWVSLNELYDYIFDKVREQNPHQTPSRDVEMQGDLYIARRSRPVTTPAPLPPELQQAIDQPLAGIRAGAVQDLARLLQARHEGLALAARQALERLTEDDSRSVSAAAAAALRSGGPPPQAAAAADPSAVSQDAAPPPAPHAAATDAAAQQPVPPRLELSTPPDAVPAVRGRARPAPRQDAASPAGQPLPELASTAVETTSPAGHGTHSGAARPPAAGFIILAISLGIAAVDILLESSALWPWWVITFACALGIISTLSGVRKKNVVSASILLWNLPLFAVFSLSVLGSVGSAHSTSAVILVTEQVIWSAVNVSLCAWILALRSKNIRNVDPFLAILTGLLAVGLVLVLIAMETGKVPVGHAAGWAIIAAALVNLLALIRALRPGTPAS